MQLPIESPATVFEAFARAAASYGDKPFLAVLPETAQAYGMAAGEISYGEAFAGIAALTDAYRAKGYGRGHRVGILMENRPGFFLHWFALNALGVSLVPINPDMRAAELEYLIGHSEIVAAVVIASRKDDVAAAAKAIGRDIPVVGPDDEPAAIHASAPQPGAPDRDTECALLYTSGTTGRPKGCVLPNEYFLYAGHWYATVGGLIALNNGSERMLTPLPVFHMNAMAYSAMAMVTTGGCLIVLDRFHPKSWWASVRDSRATIVHYLGVMPPMLMSAPESADDKRHGVRFGFGAGVDKALHDPFEARFGFPLVEAWAMTETGAGAVVVASQEPRHTGTSCFGRLGAELEARIVVEGGADAGVDEPGELLVRHAGAAPRYGFFREYLKDAEATAEAWDGGWFHTGDVVRRGPDGAFHFVDRKKNVIRRSGENISAVEVESVLMQHPAVRQVAVAPAPDPVRGDEVFACVVSEGSSPDAAARKQIAADLVAWSLSRLAYYKAPGYVAFVSALPLTSTQKIQRGALKELVAATIGSDRCIDTRSLKKRPVQKAG
ncbi:AMP-binding protein [Bradyrhizobium sp. AUGA SZCCT0240]|uniref:AMP-binding protein n=1 Tax=unclassified Bradyrhizobium TaxID=2631580 RepID=UPI001BA923C0|nr:MULTISPECIES: AMP-binding protein [unclassified Bradyrhizobium]MBR1194690.1 AMP-binding protein [Bradyrhizobium sp. AUGA SZCCT0158]MBR1239294.1 AMP-binding protein [Bradyrhizobium sp. AUGA SZCCT0274]MBR1254277.1 AMP-binding protein [Bradyrhizobium sp. AUGA SZCCT0240]